MKAHTTRKPVYVVSVQANRYVFSSERRYIAFSYQGWGHKHPHSWTADIRTAREWTEKSGAYKWIKRNHNRLFKPAGFDGDITVLSHKP